MKHYLIDLDDTIFIHRDKRKIDYNSIQMDNKLIQLLDSIPCLKYIYTNATFGHANIVLNQMGIDDKFKKVYSRDTMPLMKPHINSAIDVENNIRYWGDNSQQNHSFYFFDDLLDNLSMGKQRDWTTIWISPLYQNSDKYNFVDYAFPDIKSALVYLNKYNL